MNLDDFYSQDAGGIIFSRLQGSRFAKEIAQDFNPIHDEDAKRFCVPGDLLFALVLSRYGLSSRMRFSFAGMVSGQLALNFPDQWQDAMVVCDEKGKEYLKVEREGEICSDEGVIDDLIRCYVQFSGQTFPHILVPLMAEHNVMINPERPLVMYESMVIELDRQDVGGLALNFSGAELKVDGKRGEGRLTFELLDGAEIVGRGEKNILLSGLREYDQSGIDALVERYNARKESYAA